MTARRFKGIRDQIRGVFRRPSPRPRFSGWWVLSAAGLAVFFSGPAQTYGVSPFVEPMLAELGWSRSLFSAAYSVGTLVSAGALLLIGRQIDRWGNRLVVSVAAVAFAITVPRAPPPAIPPREP